MSEKIATTCILMPAYHAEKTLAKTVSKIPKDFKEKIILVDDKSSDNTVEIAKKLNLAVVQHLRNLGYGGNQKTCYREALKTDSEIFVMVHPDDQYAPQYLHQLIEPIEAGRADVVLGSRFKDHDPMKSGMPWWRFAANRFLSEIQNYIYKKNMSEYHTGYRAFKRDFFEKVDISHNSNDFIFDQEILAQAIFHNFRISEIGAAAYYFPEASSISFLKALKYGFETLVVLLKYFLAKKHIYVSKIFQAGKGVKS